jgi:EAL domain-containing protein (putative c-di-GMP-specific phosphodiesterase class I)
VLLPGEFIAHAERRGLIEQIDTFVLDEACRQLAEWGANDDSWEDFMMSVNVSGRQLRDRGLVARVAGALERHQIAPSRLCLEITETALIGELGAANQVLQAVADLGVRIALDDFGTGYSTLAHLQQLHTDTLKIDRSFIAQLEGGARDHDIVAAVIAMAHALGMTVVGEGIETHGQRDGLLALDCDTGQGYVFAPAVSPDDLATLRASARTPRKQPVGTADARPSQHRRRAIGPESTVQDRASLRGH